jgi:hypothetical protein
MLGDELIFVTVIDRATQAAVYIESFQSALRIWNQDVPMKPSPTAPPAVNCA